MPGHVVAIFATVVQFGLLIFQLLLAAGRPLGRAAWGGQHAVLPPRLRAGSLFAAAMMAVMSWVILARAGLVTPGAGSGPIRIATWVLTGFLCLNTLGNAASKSAVEKKVMTPVTSSLVICFLVVALS